MGLSPPPLEGVKGEVWNGNEVENIIIADVFNSSELCNVSDNENGNGGCRILGSEDRL